MDKGRSLPRSLLFVGAILFMSSNVFGAGPYDILLVASTPSDGFVDGITGAGHTVTHIQNPSDLPADLSVYSLIILADPSQAFTSPQEDQIDSFVSVGGGLILFEDTIYDGLFSAGAQSNPVSSWSGRSNRNGTTIVGTSTLVNGLSTSSTLEGGSTDPVLKGGAAVIIQWNDGVEMAVTYSHGTGNVVYFNDHDAHFLTENWKGDPAYGTQLMLNAIDYAVGGIAFSGWNVGVLEYATNFREGFLDAIEAMPEVSNVDWVRASWPDDLTVYDVVVLASLEHWIDEILLDEYVFHGGGLIVFEDDVRQGDLATWAKCNPVASFGGTVGVQEGTTVVNANSPLVVGLGATSSLRNWYTTNVALKPGALAAINWDYDGSPMAVSYSYGRGRIAYINDLNAFHQYVWRGDRPYGEALMQNVVRYTAGSSCPYCDPYTVLFIKDTPNSMQIVEDHLIEYGHSVTSTWFFDDNKPEDLSTFDVVIVATGRLFNYCSDGYEHVLDEFVATGGRMIVFDGSCTPAITSCQDPFLPPSSPSCPVASYDPSLDYDQRSDPTVLGPEDHPFYVALYADPGDWSNVPSWNPTMKPGADVFMRWSPESGDPPEGHVMAATYSYGEGKVVYFNYELPERAFSWFNGSCCTYDEFGTTLLRNTLDYLMSSSPSGACADCNQNGRCDDDELGYFDASDCDGNGVLDECDIANGTHDDANGDGVPDVCEPIILSTTQVSDRAGNVLLSFDATDPDLAYKGTLGNHIARIDYTRSGGLVTQIVTTPTDGTAPPRTLDVIYDENNPDRVIGTLSAGCSCSGSSSKFVYRDDRGRVENITTAEVLPGTTNPNGTLLEQFTYEGSTDDRVKEHWRLNADGVWALFEKRDYTDNPDGSYEVVIRKYVDLANYEAQKGFYDTDGRLTKLYEYSDLKSGAGDPGTPDATTHFTYIPTYDAGELIGEYRATIFDSAYGDYKEVSDWLIQGDYYQVGSTKTATTYRENAASTQINVRTEAYEFNVALGDYRLLSVEEPSGKMVTYSYDDANNRPELVLTEEHTAPGGVSNCQVCQFETTIQYEYELVGSETTGRVQRETRPGPNQGIDVVTYYSYDEYGRLTSQTENEGGSNPLARTTSYAYNAFDEQILSQDPADLVRASVYDPVDGRLAEEYACEYSGALGGFGDPGIPPPACMNNAFQHTLYAYHGTSGLVVTRTVPLATAPFPLSIGGTGYTVAVSTTEYDTTGFWRVGAKQPHAPAPASPPPSTLFAYDYQGRVVKTSSAGGTLGGNPVGRVVHKTIFDGRGLVKDRIVSDNGSPTETDFLVTTTTYNGDGQPALIVHPNGTQTKHLYDTFGRLAIQGRCDNIPNCAGVRVDTVFKYDNASRVTRQYIADIADTVMTYDTWGRAYKTRRRVTFTTGGTDNHNADQITLTEYDAAGNIAKTAGKLNAQHDHILIGADQVTQHGYNDLSELDSLIQHNLNALGKPIAENTQFFYDAAGRRTEQIVDPTGLIITTEFQYNAVRRVTKTIDPEGHYADSEYDSRGNLIRQVNYEADGQGDIAKSQQRWEYDAAGRLTQLARMENATTPASTAPAAASDRVTDYTYDHDGRRLTTTTYNMEPATPLVTYNDHDAIGRLTRTTDPATNWTENVYVLAGDPSGKPTGYLDRQRFSDINDTQRVRAVEYTYDSFARVLTQLDQGDPGSLVFTTTFEYDDADRRTKTIDPKNIATKSVFDMLGLRTQMIEDEGAAQFNRTTDYAYDQLGLLFTLTAHDDDHGGPDQVTTYRYDLVGRRTKIFYPDEPDPNGTPVMFEYDKAGRLTKRTDQGRVEVEYDYDKRGLLLERRTPPLTPDITDTYTYDGLGRMLTAKRNTPSEASVSDSVFTYNDLSDVESEEQALFGGLAKRLDYHYNQAGNRIAVVYPGDIKITLTYDVDALNRVTNVHRKKCPGAPTECDPEQWSGSPVQVIHYEYAGLFLERRSLHTDYDWCGITVDYEPGYDGHRRMTTIHNSVRTAGFADKVLSDYSYTYDDVGNREGITPNDPNVPIDYDHTNYFVEGLHKEITYGYDDLYRVTTANHLTALDKRDEVFDYDRLSNRSKLTEVDRVPVLPVTTELFYAHSEANEYTRIGDPLPTKDHVVHDSAGNLTQDERGYTYEYDFENRLVKVLNTKTPTDSTTFTYDALGRRIRSLDTTRPLTLHYYYDEQNVIAEYNPNDTPPLLRYFVHGSQYIDERAILNDVGAGADYYYYFRELYSVEGLVNSRGHPVEHYAYDAYGKPIIRAVQIADLNYDGEVAAFDLALVLGYWGPVQCNYLIPLCDLAPVDGDGEVESFDLAIVLGRWGPTLYEIVTSGVGIDNPYAFTGRRMDFFDFQGRTEVPQLMLYHYRARAYDPHHGRFLQRDPAGYVDGMNLYEYVSSKPTVSADPSGKWKYEDRPQKRYRKNRAVVVAERGDNVIKLANLVNLGADEYKLWMKPEPVGGGPTLPSTKSTTVLPNCRYSVPNTYKLIHGRFKMREVVLANQMGWERIVLALELKSRGVHVVPRDKWSGESLYAALNDQPDMVGFAYWGHGAALGALNPSGSTSDNVTLVWPNNIQLHHKLSEIRLTACFSAEGVGLDEWRELVAPGGIFVGFRGDIGCFTYTDPQDPVITTNPLP